MAIRNLLDRLEGRSTESLEHHRQLSRWHTGPYWRPQRTVEETCNQGVSSNWLSTKRGVVGRYCCHILFFLPSRWSGSTLWRVEPAGTPALYQPRSWLDWAGDLCTMKWRVSTSGHTVSSMRELWIGVWSQQPRLRDRKLWAAPPQRPHPQLP